MMATVVCRPLSSKRWLGVLALATIVLTAAWGGAMVTAPAPAAAPILGTPLHGLVEGGGYRAIISFDQEVPDDATFWQAGLTPKYRFNAIPAVAVTGALPAIEAIAYWPDVAYVEHHRPVTMDLATATQATRALDVWKDIMNVTGDDDLGPLAIPTLPNGTPLTGKNITIAIVDSGVNGEHPDLLHHSLAGNDTGPARLLDCIRMTGEEAQDAGPDCDSTGHGTHVAGIAAGNGHFARSENDTSLPIGAAPEADILAVDAGGVLLGQLLYPAEALDWVYANRETYGVDVVSNSWSEQDPCDGGRPAGTIVDITDKFIAAGIPVVFSAGNNVTARGEIADVLRLLFGESRPTTNLYGNNPTPGVISVANYDDNQTGARDHKIATTSAGGCSDEQYLWTYPDVAAPGQSILSASADYPGTGYVNKSGTSMAAPHVAGVVALMLQANPDLSPARVEALLINGSMPWQDDIIENNITGTQPHWGANDAAGAWIDKDLCLVTPAHAALAAAGNTSVNTEFPNFTDLPAPERFVCRDHKRGGGLIDAHLAANISLDLADWNFTLPDNDTGNETTPDPAPPDPPSYVPPPREPSLPPNQTEEGENEEDLPLLELDAIAGAHGKGTDSRILGNDRGHPSYQGRVVKEPPEDPLVDNIVRGLMGGAGFSSAALLVAVRRFL